MNFKNILLDLEILSQIKENDKISIRIIPGEKKMFVDRNNYFTSLTRWYNNYNREDSIKFIEDITNNIELTSVYITNGNHLEDGEILMASIKKGLVGLKCLKNTYSDDSIISSKLILIIDKINGIYNNLNGLINNTAEAINELSKDE